MKDIPRTYCRGTSKYWFKRFYLALVVYKKNKWMLLLEKMFAYLYFLNQIVEVICCLLYLISSFLYKTILFLNQIIILTGRCGPEFEVSPQIMAHEFWLLAYSFWFVFECQLQQLILLLVPLLNSIQIQLYLGEGAKLRIMNGVLTEEFQNEEGICLLFKYQTSLQCFDKNFNLVLSWIFLLVIILHLSHSLLLFWLYGREGLALSISFW